MSSVGSAEHALKKMYVESFDLLVVDLDLPQMHGIIMIEKVMDEFMDFEVIVVSASHQIEMAITAMRLGACDYLIKPISIDTLLVALEEAEENLILSREVIIKDDLLNVQFEELKSTQAQLVESTKLASLGTMTSGLAHELKNPLTIIKGFNDRLQHILTEDYNLGKALRCTAKVSLNVNRMLKIMAHFGEYSRTPTEELEKSSINSIVKGSFEFLYETLRVRNVEMNLNLDDSDPSVLVEAIQLEQVFTNLVNNAKDALETVGVEQPYISASTAIKGNEVVVMFSDNGAGIDPAYIEKVFDPFFTTKAAGKGTGLGLNISFQIITKFGGTITCKSPPGQGATFRITLPLAK